MAIFDGPGTHVTIVYSSANIPTFLMVYEDVHQKENLL